ncbi:MAG: DNA polymerase IV [Clostridia bacterium]|nr:DNA polymerase IV [Clostridia bacterium]
MAIKDRVILHCDANNFFASVSAKLHPEYKGKPIAVCGDPEKRHGIVLAKSQEAKKYGVATGDVIWEAKLKCPDLLIVKAEYDKYIEYSNMLFEIYSRFTDQVECFGMDECWLDVTHSKIFGDGETIANTLRETIKKELGITISAGVSFNKVFAKLASDMKKPDATTIISKENYKEIIYDLPVSDMIMIGRRTTKHLAQMNIHTIGDLAYTNREIMRTHFGVNGVMYVDWANGLDTDPVKLCDKQGQVKQISNSITTYRDLTTKEEKLSVIRALCELISSRLVHLNAVTSGIYLGLKFDDFEYYGKQLNIPTTCASRSLFDGAKAILDKAPMQAVRLISLGTTKLTRSEPIQLSMFGNDLSKDIELSKSIDKIKQKYGYSSIQPASTLANLDLCESIKDTDYKPFKN